MEFINLYWTEFLTIAVIHLFAVASPGPDFAVVLRESLIFGRRKAVICSIGVGLAILVHVFYALVGIGLLIKNSQILFSIVQYAGAAYLVYIGIGALRSSPKPPNGNLDHDDSPSQTDFEALRLGFLTNVLNPKATLFFLLLFTGIISQETPIIVQAIYGVWLAIATGLWFAILSFLFSSEHIRSFFRNYSHWIDRIMGVLLIALALHILFNTHAPA